MSGTAPGSRLRGPPPWRSRRVHGSNPHPTAPAASPPGPRCCSGAPVGRGAERRHRPRGDDRVLHLGRPVRAGRTSKPSSTHSTRQSPTSRSTSPSPTGPPTGTSCRPGLAGGAAPDVFAMDGPLFPDYRVARRAARPDARTSPARRLRPDHARRTRASRDFTTADGRQFGSAARPQRDRAVLQQGDVRCGRHPLSRRHLGLGQALRGRQAAHHRHERRRPARPVGPLHRDHRHGELLVVARVAERRRHPLARRHDRPCSDTPRPRAASSASRT